MDPMLSELSLIRVSDGTGVELKWKIRGSDDTLPKFKLKMYGPEVSGAELKWEIKKWLRCYWSKAPHNFLQFLFFTRQKVVFQSQP